jgi:hypothetical protein
MQSITAMAHFVCLSSTYRTENRPEAVLYAVFPHLPPALPDPSAFHPIALGLDAAFPLGLPSISGL